MSESDKNEITEEQSSEQQSSEPQSIEGVLERVSESDPEAAKEISHYIAVHRSHKGPMPSPEALQQYSLTLSDLPERMMRMAEKSQTEKAKQGSKVLELKEKEIEVQRLEVVQADSAHVRETSTQRIALFLAFITVVICIVGAFYLAIIDKTEVALVIGGTTVIGIVGAFLKNKMSESKKNLKK
ncbi:MAG: DUF2335 domain-containing protein [Colwellia sp.]